MTKRCVVRSSITGEQCRDVAGHRDDSPYRFHRFQGAVGSKEKRLSHLWWHGHVSGCAKCKGDGLCEEGVRCWEAMEAHGCLLKSWCALEDGHGLDCVPLDELPPEGTTEPHGDALGEREKL